METCMYNVHTCTLKLTHASTSTLAANFREHFPHYHSLPLLYCYYSFICVGVGGGLLSITPWLNSFLHLNVCAILYFLYGGNAHECYSFRGFHDCIWRYVRVGVIRYVYENLFRRQGLNRCTSYDEGALCFRVSARACIFPRLEKSWLHQRQRERGGASVCVCVCVPRLPMEHLREQIIAVSSASLLV